MLLQVEVVSIVAYIVFVVGVVFGLSIASKEAGAKEEAARAVQAAQARAAVKALRAVLEEQRRDRAARRIQVKPQLGTPWAVSFILYSFMRPLFVFILT